MVSISPFSRAYVKAVLFSLSLCLMLIKLFSRMTLTFAALELIAAKCKGVFFLVLMSKIEQPFYKRTLMGPSLAQHAA